MTRVSVDHSRAAHIMFDNGLTVDQIQYGLNTLPQPVTYYFNVSDILVYIKQIAIAH